MRLVLQRALPLRGHLTGPDGRPAAGAFVALMEGGETPIGRRTVADQEGRFAFTGLSPGQPLLLRAHHGEAMSTQDVAIEGDLLGPLRVPLAANARPTVTGQVVGEDGTPVPFALLRFQVVSSPGGGGSSSRMWLALLTYALADEQGRFSLRCLWPGLPYELRARAAGYSEETASLEPLAPGEVRDSGPVTMPVADVVVAGRVVDDEGNPVPNVVVAPGRAAGTSAVARWRRPTWRAASALGACHGER